MTVQSIEVLENATNGTRFEVNSRNLGTRVWERVETGLRSIDTQVILGFDKFVGAVSEGRVVDTGQAIPEPGYLYQTPDYNDGRYKYLVLGVNLEEQTATCLLFRRNEQRDSLTTRTFNQLRSYTLLRDDQRPDWYQAAWVLGLRWFNERERRQRDTELMRTAEREVRDLRQQLAESVAAATQAAAVPVAVPRTVEVQVTGTLKGTVAIEEPPSVPA